MAKNFTSPSMFDDLAAAFADYGTSVRGYVRYQLAQRNLRPYVTGPPLNILDVGGGSGGDTAWLVGLGHKVTYVEPSFEQRRFAERRFNFLLDEKERARIQLVGRRLRDLPTTARGSFDMVLIHAVAMYQPEPEVFIRRALGFVRPGGLVSLLEKGFYGTELRDIRDQNFTDLRRLHRTGRSVNNLKQSVRAIKPEEVEVLLTEAGFEVLDWSGIRLLTDDFTMPVKAMNPAHLKIVLDAEYAHGHHPAIRGQAQLLHFIARQVG